MNRGFTLLELLVVLVIMTLMVALVPPLLSSVGLSTEVRGAARDLASGLRAARSEAVLRQRPVALTLDLEQRTAVVDGRGKRIELPDDEDVTIRLYTAQSELVDEQRGSIRFFPDGSSTGGYIALTQGPVEYRINVDWLIGHVTIEDRNAGH